MKEIESASDRIIVPVQNMEKLTEGTTVPSAPPPPPLPPVHGTGGGWLSSFSHHRLERIGAMSDHFDWDSSSAASIDSDLDDHSTQSTPAVFFGSRYNAVVSDVTKPADSSFQQRRVSHGLVVDWLKGVNSSSVGQDPVCTSSSTTAVVSDSKSVSDSKYFKRKTLAYSNRELNAYSPSNW